MNPSQQRCLLASVIIHGTLLSVLLFAPAFKQKEPAVPVLTMVPVNLLLTDGDKAGGGTPDAPPPQAPSRPAPPAPAVPQPEVRKAAAPEPEPEPKPKPVRPPEKPVSKPVAAAPEPAPPKTANPSQDTDAKVHPKSNRREIKTSKEIKVADVVKTRDRKAEAEDRKAAEAAAEREAVEERRRAYANRVAQANEARQRLAESLSGAAQAVGKHTSASTDIEMPGPGGQAYAPYGSYLGAFFKGRWRKPSALAVRSASVVVELTVARNGRVLDSKFEKSGYRELDDSVVEVIRRYPQLRPLPEGTTDAQRTIRIRFTLQADSNT